MKFWKTNPAGKAAQMKLAAQELSDDLMAQIAGGEGNGTCHGGGSSGGGGGPILEPIRR